MAKPWPSLQTLTGWHLRSVEGSRHNAHLACTALAGRRREQEDVERFLETYLAARSVPDRSA